MLMLIYVLIWFVVAAAAGILYLTGNFNEMMMTVFGFLVSTLFFMSITAVLPWWVSQPFSSK